MPSSVLPFRFPGEKKQSTIHLPEGLWEEIERITAAERPGKRNEVLEFLLTWAVIQHRAEKGEPEPGVLAGAEKSAPKKPTKK